MAQPQGLTRYYETGDGRVFATFEEAAAHARRVFRRTGVVLAVEARP